MQHLDVRHWTSAAREQIGSCMTSNTRLLSAALIGAAVFGVAACGGSEKDTDATASSSASSASAAPDADAATEVEGLSREAQYAGDPTQATDPSVVGQVFVESALGNVDVMNAPTLQDAINMTSAFLTDSFMTALLAEGAADPDGVWRTIPWKIQGLDDGYAITDAEATVTSLAMRDSGDPDNPGVDVDVAYRWTFDGHGWASGTRSYTLWFRPGADRDSGGFQWQIDGSSVDASAIETGD